KVRSIHPSSRELVRERHIFQSNKRGVRVIIIALIDIIVSIRRCRAKILGKLLVRCTLAGNLPTRQHSSGYIKSRNAGRDVLLEKIVLSQLLYELEQHIQLKSFVCKRVSESSIIMRLQVDINRPISRKTGIERITLRGKFIHTGS